MTVPSSLGERLKGLRGIVVLLATTLAAGFLLWVLTISERGIAHVDARNIADLQILVDGLQQWEQAARRIGQNNIYAVEGREDEAAARDGSFRRRLFHPDFGQFVLNYTPGTPGCIRRSAILPTADGERAELVVLGEARPTAGWATAKPLNGWATICFAIHIPLKNLVKPADVAKSLSHLLIADRSGRVIDQIGSDRLPVERLSEVPNLPSQVRMIAARIDPTRRPADAPRDDAADPVDKRILGTPYRFYELPFSFPQPVADATGNSGSGGDARAADAIPGYLAVGVAPRGAINQASRHVPRAVLAAFVLTLGMLLALTPILKLRLIGAVDDIAPLEAAGAVIGLVVACALATATVSLSLLTGVARVQASTGALAIATSMARATGGELYDLVYGADKGSLITRMTSDLGRRSDDKVIRRFDAPPDVGRVDYPRPDTAWVSAADGGIADGAVQLSVRPDGAGSANVGERQYFRDATRGPMLGGVDRQPAFLHHASAQTAHCVSSRFAIEQIRSLTDGVAKTALAFRIAPDCAFPTAKTRATGAGILGFNVILRSLLAPVLPVGADYMVVDPGDRRARALFHSNPARALVESVSDVTGAPQARRALADLGPAAAKCATALPARAIPVASFDARYDGRMRIFAVARIPCTPWLLLAYVDRDAVDEQAADAILSALSIGACIIAVALLLLLAAALTTRRTAWLALWPDPLRAQHIGGAAKAIRGVAIASVVVILTGLAFDLPSARVRFLLVALLAPAASLLIVWGAVGRSKEARWLRHRLFGVGDPCTERRLTLEVERRYRRLAVALLVTLAPLPTIACVLDGWQGVAGFSRDQGLPVETSRLRARADQVRDVVRTYSAARRAEMLIGDVRPDDLDGGDFRWRDPAAAKGSGRDLTHLLYDAVRGGYRSVAPLAADPPPVGTPGSSAAGIAAPRLGLPWLVLLASEILAFVILIRAGLRTIVTGLFGFGIPLEAVEYPLWSGEPGTWDWAALDAPGTIVVAPPFALRQAILAGASAQGPVPVEIIDLFAVTEDGAPPFDPERLKAARYLVLTNLDLLMRDPRGRVRALRYMERLMDDLERTPGRSIVLLADLSPLERLLQRYEIEAEELHASQASEAGRKMLDEFKSTREDMRWSRLLEGFATRSFRQPHASVTPEDGDRLAAECPEPDEAGRRRRARIAQRVLEELQPLPDAIVLASLPGEDRDKAARIRHVAKTIDAPSSRAVIDYFSTIFIEHYQLIWSASSHAERLVMFHLAHGRLISLARAYAVRTLVRRGAVSLDPVPRLFNRSFAQFVRNVEKPVTLKRWRDAVPAAWSRAQLPILFVIVGGLAALVLLIRGSGESAAALAPVLVTATPALLQALGVFRRPQSA